MPTGDREIEAGLAAARHALVSDTAFDLNELFLIGTFLRRPPAEMHIVSLRKGAILAAMARCQTPLPKKSGVRHRAAVPDTTEALF